MKNLPHKNHKLKLEYIKLKIRARLVNRYTDQATSWKVRGVNARRGQDYFLQKVQTGSGTQPASFLWVPGFLTRGTAAEV